MTDLESVLRQKCPTIMRGGALKGGCSVPTGWEAIVTELSEKLEAHAAASQTEPLVLQIKAKFGGLRYYLSAYDQHTSELIRTAESASERTCEVCGRLGSPENDKAWNLTLCEDHKR